MPTRVCEHYAPDDVPSADPNASQVAFGYRGALRGALGLDLPLWHPARFESGFATSLSPLLELHEPSGSDQPLPNQYWRGRLSLDVGYRWRRARDALRLYGQLAHESDHETAHAYSRPGFLTLNHAALGARGALTLGAFQLTATLEARIVALSCTRDRAVCEDFEGSTSAGAAAGLDLGAPALALLSLRPFLALWASGVLSHEEVRGERRIVLHAGVYRAVLGGQVRVLGLLWLGNDVGITRSDDLAQLGARVSYRVLL